MSQYDSHNLPEGWALVALGDGLAGDVQSGFACGVNNRDEIGIPHLRPMNVSIEGTIAYDDVKYVHSDRAEDDRYWLKPGDVLFNNTNSAELVGKTALYENESNVVFSNHMTRIRCSDAIMSKYCALALHQKWSEGYFFKHCNRHVSQASISQAVLKATMLPLPPLAEQKRIVAKVEALVAEVRSVRHRLAAIRDILKRFRQIVLTHACSGKLTETWRIGQNSVALAADEFEAAIMRRLDKHTRDTSNARSKGVKPAQPPTELVPRIVDITHLPEIPLHWTWVYLPDIGYMNRGKSQHRPRSAPHLYGGPYPFVQTGDIAQSGGRITSHRQTYSEAGLDQSRMWPAKTVAITIAANIANSAILTYDACFPDSVVGVIPDFDVAMPEYVEFFIRTAKHDLELYAPGTAQKNINISILNNLAVPLPSLAEQQEIVRRVTDLLALADTIEQRVETARMRVKSLTQSILARAFRGELVPTEAKLAAADGRDYETVEQLLERMRFTVAKHGVTKQSKRNRSVGSTQRITEKSEAIMKRSILKVLKDSSKALTPEELFRQAGYDIDDVDDFYEQLRAGVTSGDIIQKPLEPDPANPKVLLNIKGR